MIVTSRIRWVAVPWLWAACVMAAAPKPADPAVPKAEGMTPAAKQDRSIITDRDRAFWSFQPLRRVEPPAVKDQRWGRNAIDRFVLAKLEAKGLKPNAQADARTLVRRIYFDLIGLPPRLEEVEAFVRECSPAQSLPSSPARANAGEKGGKGEREQKAVERLVDRLLASPHHGERWARHWLDLARFGESHGYEQDYDRPFAYTYRDFVIRALNDDLPYDTFVRWQIAGDELEPDNAQAWFATGFLGAGTHATQITANQAEKERYDELDDQVQTIGTAMLGLTIGCARCHDHKFDPIPTKDYYNLLATFTTTVRCDKDVDLNPAQTRSAQAAWEREHAPLVAARETFEKKTLPTRLEAWLQTNPELPHPDWLWLDLGGFKVSGGYYGINKSEGKPDGSHLVTVTAGAPDTITFTAKTSLTNVTAVRLEALTDRALPHHGPGWSKDGGFTLTAFTITAKPLKGEAPPATLTLAKRIATTDEQEAKEILPWKDGGKTARDHAAVFELEKPAGFAEGAEFSFQLKFANDFDRNLIGRLRVSVTTRNGAGVAGWTVAAKDYEKASAAWAKRSGDDPPPVPRNGRTPPAEGTPALAASEREAVARIYRGVDAEWRKLDAAVTAHAAQEPRPKLVKALVCSEGLPALRLHTQGPDFYEQTFQLKRGDLAQKQGEATPGFLRVLMRAPEQEQRWLRSGAANARTPQRRTGLADWLTDADNGAGSLLARVMVNRLWQHHFGRGLVATPSDFGATGAAPTHPELLDWLASELIRNGWRLKALHKLIMTSAVYLQGTGTDPTRLGADPDNSLWWHRKPMRLEAEIIRDSLLAVSGRLDPAMYGPGSLDEGMTRRSIYFTVKRSKLIPMMVQFDWPDSLQSIGLRVNTTVAPQALLMMNNVNVRAAARDFAKRLKPAAEKSLESAVKSAYGLALGRAPTRTELADSVAFLRGQMGTHAPAQSPDLALADFAQAVMSLNEFVFVN